MMTAIWHRLRPTPRPPSDLERAALPEPPPVGRASTDTWMTRAPDVARGRMQRCTRTLTAGVQAMLHPELRHPPQLDTERGTAQQDV